MTEHAQTTSMFTAKGSKRTIPLSVLIPTRNEQQNIAHCLAAIVDWAGEIVVVDSQSSDSTTKIARQFGADVFNFEYKGGWPKKRQWALDNLSFRNEWILLLDADEILTESTKKEIASGLSEPHFNGYYLRYHIVFLDTQLRHGDTELWKLSLFRLGRARFECRSELQDKSMCDMEVHEHIICDGAVGKISSPVQHRNYNSIARYIDKHNYYSNWESLIYSFPNEQGLQACLWGNQAQRRRWAKRIMINNPIFPIVVFIYTYFIRRGFMDGKAGFIYCAFKAIQRFHVQTKIYERQLDSVVVDQE